MRAFVAHVLMFHSLSLWASPGSVHAFLSVGKKAAGNRMPRLSRRHASFSSCTRLQSHWISIPDALKQQNDIQFIDASWYHKGDRNGRTEFEQGPRIAGSLYFDLADICNGESSVWAMLPPQSLLEAWMDHCNVKPEEQQLVVYGKEGARFTPRVWFTLQRAFPNGSVRLLRGSFEEWVEAGGAVDTEPVKVVQSSDLKESSNLNNQDEKELSMPIDTIDLEGMKEAVLNPDGRTVILDARGSSFAAKGHMPGAIHVPYSSLTQKGTTIQFRQDLKEVFEQAGVDPLDEETRIICTCGSGVSACSLYLALQECGRTGETVVYDGSWSEWKTYDELPKVLPGTCRQ